MKKQADWKGSGRVFEVGDFFTWPENCPKYIQPFLILKRIGQVSYHIEMPPHCRIHHTFHASKLKNEIGSNLVVAHLTVTLFAHGNVLLEAEAILIEVL